MALKAVRDAVEARLSAEWNEFPFRFVNQDGETPTPNQNGEVIPGVTPWLRVTYPVANSQQQSLGSPGANVWREEGAFRITIGVETGDGLDRALEWADGLAAIFRGKSFDGVTTWAPSSPVIDDRNYQGGWYKVSFAVPYWYDLIG
jgi:hypothetical protein